MSDYVEAVEGAPPIGPYDLEQESDNVSDKYEVYVRKPSDYENEIAKVPFFDASKFLAIF